MITIVLIVGFLGASSNITNYHGVSVMKNSFSLSNLDDSLTTYTKDWLLKREKEIKSYTANSNRQYPVYFVNAHGGGIRAIVWTTMVIGTLDSIMRSDTVKANKLGFQHYAFSYSGASGGTVGLMLLTASRFENRKEFSKDIALYPKSRKNYTVQIT